MSFRDDHDAALARAAALEAENARLREEVERLKNPPEPEQPKKKNKKKKPEPTPPRERLPVLQIIGGVLFLAIAIPVVVCIERADPERARMAERKRAEAQAHIDRVVRLRWRALVGLEPCAADATVGLHYALRATPDHYDPRDPPADIGYIDQGAHLELLTRRNCFADLGRIAIEPLLPADVRALAIELIRARRALESELAPLVAYLRHRDWQEDDHAAGRAMWAELRPRVAAWRDLLRRYREAAVPAARAAIAAAAAEHERVHGRDLVWWQLEIGVAYRDLVAQATALLEPDGLAPRAIDRDSLPALLRPAADRVLALVDEAPIELRRLFRDFSGRIDYLREYGNPAEGLAALNSRTADPLWGTTGGDAPLLLVPSP